MQKCNKKRLSRSKHTQLDIILPGLTHTGKKRRRVKRSCEKCFLYSGIVSFEHPSLARAKELPGRVKRKEARNQKKKNVLKLPGSKTVGVVLRVGSAADTAAPLSTGTARGREVGRNNPHSHH